jgi:hypothetical protein
MKPGIYFALPEEIYHADAALGSNDLKLVRRDPAQFWLRSKMNPKRHLYNSSTKSTVLGTAMHKIVLEGMAAFLRTYVRREDDHEGATPSEKAQITKAAKKGLREDQTLLHGEEFDLCLDTERLVTSHPDLRTALTGGASEVSVFWEGPGGVPLKARFDRLKPGGIGDLKSIANERDDYLPTACKQAIKRYRYYVQAAHYLDGLAQFGRFLETESVWTYNKFFGSTQTSPPTIEHLSLVKDCAIAQRPDRPPQGFQFIFVQTSGAPATWSCTLFPGNPILDIGRAQVEQGIANYLLNTKLYGTGPWPATWRLEELDMSEMPGGEFGWE